MTSSGAEGTQHIDGRFVGLQPVGYVELVSKSDQFGPLFTSGSSHFTAHAASREGTAINATGVIYILIS